jgi:hypothetical protein
MQHLLDKIGELNPQLFREIKGRVTINNIVSSIGISLLAQFVLLGNASAISSIVPSFHIFYIKSNYLIMITILMITSYTIIKDLGKEQRKGTLNFIRLSPQTHQSILLGKLLGVPILLYLGFLIAFPIHLWLGLYLQIPCEQILAFYIILLAATIFYNSAALLFALVSYWFGGFQAWVGSGFIVMLLQFTQPEIWRTENFARIFATINPLYFIPPEEGYNYKFFDFRWFGIPLGNNLLIMTCFSLLIYSIGSYFIWQSLGRCYYDRYATMLSKKQSYFLTASVTIITLGCANSGNEENLISLIVINFILFFYLITALTPQHQIVYDWSRYHHIYKHKLIQDLIWGEKSPAILAIAINALIVFSSVNVFIFLSAMPLSLKMNAVIAWVSMFILLLIYAVIAQMLLLMKNEKILLFTHTIMSIIISLPLIMLPFLEVYENPLFSFVALFSIAAPVVILSPPTNIIFTGLGVLIKTTILGFLLLHIKQRLQKAGESPTQVLLAEK